MKVTSFDLETVLATRGVFYPEIVCGVGAGEMVAGANETCELFLHCIRNYDRVVGVYLAYDVGCVLERLRYDTRAVREIWEAMEAGCLWGVDVAEMLLDIATNDFDRHETQGYSQVNIARWNGLEAKDKDSNSWQKQFSQLDGVPLSLYPPSAVEYLAGDADTPLAIYERQLLRGVLDLVPSETYCQVVLGAVAAVGVRTNAARVARLRANVEARMVAYKERLTPLGLVRANGTKNKRAAQKLMVCACEAQGRPVPLTPKDGVALDRDNCILSGNEDLVVYSELTSAHLLRGRADDLAEGIHQPLQTSFTSLRNTGRTSSRKPKPPHVGHQAQNWPRGAVKIRDLTTPTGWRVIDIGARECLQPRPGYAYLWGDFEAAEMHTLAESCLQLVGFSQLGELLNAGVDPHAFFGGRAFEGITGEPAEIARTVLARPDAKHIRNKAKPVNFGKPGGMGSEKWVLFARKQYDQIFTLEEARYYGNYWFSLFPEVKAMHNLIGSWCEQGGGTCDMTLPNGFVRGGCYFPAACNLTFQGPAAFAAKSALKRVARECYAVPESSLYGCRAVNLVHDEILLETPLDRIPSASVRLCEIMEKAFNEVTPNYPTSVEVIASMVWSKSAKPVQDANGHLILWHPPAE